MKPILRTILLFTIPALIFSGCWFVRIGMRNMDTALFDKPQKVPFKNHHPINDSIRLSALWVGHSTVLVQMEDKVIIVDPVFEDVIGSTMLRKREAGLNLEDISKLDIVLISHSHMDHMSLPTLKRIDKLFPKASLVFPVGTEKYLPSYDMNMVMIKTGNSAKRHYIGETKEIDGVKVTSVFAEHEGGRYGFDTYMWNVPGYTGYIIEYKGLTIFYAGDTIYDEDAFKAIGGKFKINLALIPIGPCRDCEEVNGNAHHVATYGAMILFDDLKADYMIPVHWGAIRYFNDPDTPLATLKELIEEYGYKSVSRGETMDRPYSEKIKILSEGGQIIFQHK